MKKEPPKKSKMFFAKDLSHKDLSYQDLSNSDFRRANLKGANLSNSNISNSDLSGANLEGAELIRTNLENCRLSKVNLTDSFLTEANLKNCYLQGAKMKSAYFNGTNFESSCLTNSCLANSDLSSSNLSNADLRASNLENTNLSNVVFKNANLSGCNLDNAILESTNFENANISGASFRNVHSCIGSQVTSSYGNSLFKRTVQDLAYIEEYNLMHPVKYYLWKASSNCGRSLSLWLAWCIIIIITFALIYQYHLGGVESFAFTALTKSKDYDPNSVAPMIYYSVVTFTTLGFGDITPKTQEAAWWVMSEVVIGYIMLGGLVSIFATKLARRS